MLRNLILAFAIVLVSFSCAFAADDVIEFEAKDLDGNIISSTELFKAN